MAEVFTARFDVVFYEFDYEARTSKKHERSGFLECGSFTEAMKAIEGYYGDELASCHIQMFEHTLIEMTKELADEIAKENALS